MSMLLLHQGHLGEVRSHTGWLPDLQCCWRITWWFIQAIDFMFFFPKINMIAVGCISALWCLDQLVYDEMKCITHFCGYLPRLLYMWSDCFLPVISIICGNVCMLFLWTFVTNCWVWDIKCVYVDLGPFMGLGIQLITQMIVIVNYWIIVIMCHAAVFQRAAHHL